MEKLPELKPYTSHANLSLALQTKGENFHPKGVIFVSR